MKEISSDDLDRIFATSKNYGGTFSKDNLPPLQSKFYVINMSNHNEEGTHWVCVINTKPKQCIYFDSFGMPMPEEVLERMKATKKAVCYSDLDIQDFNSSNCGYYCIAMIQQIEQGKSYSEAINSFHHNTKKNEQAIIKYSVQNGIKAGGSILASVKKQVQKVSTAVLPSAVSRRINATLDGKRKGSTARFSTFMDNTADRKIDKIVVGRKPVVSGVKIVLEGLSLGKFSKRQKELGYDDTYHNYTLVHFAGDPPDVWTKIEKNHVVESAPASADDFKNEHYEIPTHGKDLTVKGMINKSVEKNGADHIYQYDGGGSNCQEFIKNVIEDNDLTPADDNAKELIKPQDAKHLLGSLGVLEPFHKITTDIASVLDKK